MNKTIYDIFAKNGLPVPGSVEFKKEHRLLYNIDNIKEHTNNIQEQNCLTAMPFGQVKAETASQETGSKVKCEPLDSISREEGSREREPLDSDSRESGLETAPDTEPFGPHNIKRALWQLFKNDTGFYKLKVRLNMTDGDNVEFIAPLQKTPKKSNFVKHAPDPEQASEFWQAMRREIKSQYSILPLLGKFHEKTGGRKSIKQSFTVEPDCYGAVWFDSSVKSYRFSAMIYGFVLEQEIIDDAYITDKQKRSGVVGQTLWINPAYDTRQRPITAAERRRQGKRANYQ